MLDSLFKIGDKVTIREDLKGEGYRYGERKKYKMYFNSHMSSHSGCKVTIAEVFEHNGDIFYRLKEDGDSWSWASSMFEESELYYDFKDQAIRNEYSLLIKKLNLVLPYRLSLKKVKVIGNRMKCQFEDKYTKENYSSYSICNENDLFIFETGVMICAYRALKKFTDEKLEKLTK